MMDFATFATNYRKNNPSSTGTEILAAWQDYQKSMSSQTDTAATPAVTPAPTPIPAPPAPPSPLPVGKSTQGATSVAQAGALANPNDTNANKILQNSMYGAGPAVVSEPVDAVARPSEKVEQKIYPKVENKPIIENKPIELKDNATTDTSTVAQVAKENIEKKLDTSKPEDLTKKDVLDVAKQTIKDTTNTPITQIGPDILGILQALAAGINAGSAGRSLNFEGETTIGRKRAQDRQDAVAQAGLQDQLKLLNTQKEYNAEQKKIDQDFQIKLNNAKTDQEKIDAQTQRDWLSKENQKNRDNNLEMERERSNATKSAASLNSLGLDPYGLKAASAAGTTTKPREVSKIIPGPRGGNTVSGTFKMTPEQYNMFLKKYHNGIDNPAARQQASKIDNEEAFLQALDLQVKKK